MEVDKLTIAICVGAAVIFYFGIKYKERKEGELADNFLRMDKEGDFRGIKQIFRKQAITLSVLSIVIIAVSIVRMFSDAISASMGLVFGAVLAWRAFYSIRRWSAYKKLEEHISYRMSDREVEEFWLRDNAAITEGLLDYLYKKSFLGQEIDERLNEKERMIYVLGVLDEKVCDGGFRQFFENTGGVVNSDIVKYAYEVGARDIARICDKALGIESSSLPEDEKDELLSEECDAAFNASEENLKDICAEYARSHKKEFLS